jgi:16S rRNA (uracil1498-N3)-methyltransferase
MSRRRGERPCGAYHEGSPLNGPKLDDASAWRLDTFLVPPRTLGDPTVVLDGAEGHHALHVVRAAEGDVVRLVDGEGVEALARIDGARASQASLSILERKTHRREEGALLTLVQALLKGSGFSEVVRRATELGVAALVPVTTERSVGRVPKGREDDRAARWLAVARSALKQCRGVYLPRIEAVRPLSAVGPFLAEAQLGLVAWEEEQVAGIREVIARAGRPRRIALVVGPEGGLSAAEIEVLASLGARPVSVGRRVLRADWAGPAAAAMVASAVGGLLP